MNSPEYPPSFNDLSMKNLNLFTYDGVNGLSMMVLNKNVSF